MKLCGCKELCFKEGTVWGHLDGVMCKYLGEKEIGDGKTKSKCFLTNELVILYTTDKEYKEYTKTNSVVKKGFAQAMDGETLCINTQSGEMVTVHIKDREVMRELYCRHLKITIEVIDESELD